MARNGNGVIVMWISVMLLVAMAGAAREERLCNIEPTKMSQCHPAVTGKSPPPPTKQCCNLLHQANLPCLCGFKSALPAFGIDPANAFALPKKCGLKTPPQCQLP